MSVANTFKELSKLLRRIESGGWTIEYVETKGEKLSGAEPLHVEVGVSSPLLDTLQNETNVRIEGPSIDSSTTVLDVTIPATEEEDANVTSSVEDDPSYTEQDGPDTQLADGRGELQTQGTDLESSRPDEMEDGTSKHNGVEDIASTPDQAEDSKPAHHDPEQLREAYENHDTFAEMTDALGVDVSPQTVRHFMIRHGIHEPASHSSSTNTDTETEDESPSKTEREGIDRSSGVDADPDQDDEEEDADTTDDDSEERETIDDRSTDGSTNGNEPEPADEPEPGGTPATNGEVDTGHVEETALPDGVSIDDVKDAVRSASTVYEVRRELDLDGETTREVLKELDLLDLVTGRLAYKPNQDTSLDQIETATDSTEEIEKRIRSALSYQTTVNSPRQAADVGGNYTFE